jgi:polyisoprenoid-binding protein YceI
VAARGSRRWIKWLAGAAAVLVVLVVGGPFVYIHFVSGKAPAPFSVRSAASATPSSAASGQSGGSGTGPGTGSGTTAGAAKPVAGTWNVARGSQVGYRVKEVLFGQDNIAVGRTSDIAGHLTIRGTTVTAGSFTVQMATIKSDQAERDVQFNGRIMDASAFPTGKLTLTRPISFAPLPAAGVAKDDGAGLPQPLVDRVRGTQELLIERVDVQHGRLGHRLRLHVRAAVPAMT